MSKIGPDGVVKSDIFNDFALFSLNNITIGQYAAKILQGSNNAILGNNAGLIAVNVNNSVYLGFEAGLNLKNGDNNIIIGADNAQEPLIDNSINIGYNNISNSTITIGNNLTNDGYINIGTEHSQIKVNKSTIILNEVEVSDVINLGFDNKAPIDSITIGNHNSNINICIGSSNYSTNNNSIIIGNDIINNNYSLNINNLICQYEDDDKKLIYLGVGIYRNIPIIVGSVADNPTINNDNNQFLINGSLSINRLVIKNSSNLAVTLKGNDRSPDVIYYLPTIPTDITNLFLTVNRNGSLEWKEITNDMITTIITRGDLICNNIEGTTIEGFGYFLINLSLSDKTTDNLKEGFRNIYFNSSLITEVFLSIVKSLTTDNLTEGTNNLYYNYDLYSSNFTNHFSDINSDNLNNGLKTRFYKSVDFTTNSFDYLTSITTDDIRIGAINHYYSKENFDKYSNSIINNLKEGSKNLYYTNTRFQGVFNNYIRNNNTNIISQGTSNFYYNSAVVNCNIDLIVASLNTDNLKEGRGNLFITSNRLYSFFHSNTITTNQIKGGSSNLYFSNISNFELNTDGFKEGSSNRYYTNDCNIKDRIIITSTTNDYKEGSNNIYLKGDIINSNYANYLKTINTDGITENNNYKFIKNNFYNNDLIINGFLKASNVNNIDIDISKLNLQKDELSIGPLTEVINVFDYDNNQLFINSSLSNIKLEINYDEGYNSNVPFIVVENRVGINNLNPTFNLHIGTGNDTAFFSKIQMADISGNDGSFGIMMISSNNQVNGHDFKIQTRTEASSSFTDSLIVKSSGNVGIGVGNPAQKLQVAGSILISGTVLSSFSDMRLKEKTGDLKNPLEVICRLNGFKYKLNERAHQFGFDDNSEMIGLNAQEVKEVIPEVVSLAPFDMERNNENGAITSISGDNYLSIQYERIIPYLIECIKELKKENDIIKKLINKNA